VLRGEVRSSWQGDGTPVPTVAARALLLSRWGAAGFPEREERFAFGLLQAQAEPFRHGRPDTQQLHAFDSSGTYAGTIHNQRRIHRLAVGREAVQPGTRRVNDRVAAHTAPEPNPSAASMAAVRSVCAGVPARGPAAAKAANTAVDAVRNASHRFLRRGRMPLLPANGTHPLQRAPGGAIVLSPAGVGST